MNLRQLTKSEGKLLKFVHLAKRLQAEYYPDKLNSALCQEGCQVVYFCTSLAEDYQKLAKAFHNVPFHLCLPDEMATELNASSNMHLIKLSALKNIAAKDKVLVLIKHEALSLKFGDYFGKIGLNNILIYARNKSYARVARSLLLHMRDIYAVYGSLDVLSQEYYAATLCGKISGDISKIMFSDEKQYLLEGYSPIQGDIVIDGGAYDGVTAKAFCDVGGNVYAFEMDGLNYQKGLQLAQEEKFILENMGLGSKKTRLQYKSGGVGSTVAKDGDCTAQLIDIDTYAKEQGIARIDFIKMDIEGSELDALRGAAQSIRKYKPRLAICTYHKLQDMWKIPLYIKKLRPDYEFAFRHHVIDGGQEYLWNQEEKALLDAYGLDYMCKTMWESVLYCR